MKARVRPCGQKDRERKLRALSDINGEFNMKNIARFKNDIYAGVLGKIIGV